jgi:hypothetical protein
MKEGQWRETGSAGHASPRSAAMAPMVVALG